MAAACIPSHSRKRAEYGFVEHSTKPSSVSFFWPSQSSGRELSEVLSAYHLCAKRAHRVFFSQDSPSLAQNSVSPLFQEGETHPAKKPPPPNKSAVCANNFGTVDTNCPPFFSLQNKQKGGRRVCANCLCKIAFIWVGVFWGGLPSCESPETVLSKQHSQDDGKGGWV